MAAQEVLQIFITNTSLQLLVLAAIPLVYALRRLFVRDPFPPKTPDLISNNYPIVGASGFFSQRWEFFQQAMARSPTGNFSFHLGKLPVIGLSGPDSRRVFLESKQLNLSKGYAAMFGEGPSVPTDDDEFFKLFNNRLITMLRQENFVRNLPQLLADTRSRLEEVAALPGGIFDPFNNLYRIVFQLTMRTVGCNEIANDLPLLWKTLDIYESIEGSSTMAGIIFPWLPTPGRIKRLFAGIRLHRILQRIVTQRQKTGKREDDALQFMIDQGDDLIRIISFIVGALFAGQLNSGVNAAFVVASLATNPEWTARVREEVATIARRYNPDSTAPLIDQLSNIPVQAWESEFEIIDLCLRDSIRLQTVGAIMRRNTSGKDVMVGEQIIPSGACVAYHIADVHHNPSIFPDPDLWDPSRYLPDRAEDKKVQYGYLGWGAGRHPCLGMRFAKLEMSVILAHFVAMFEFQLCTQDGQISTKKPRGNVNSFSARKPTEQVFVKVTRIDQ